MSDRGRCHLQPVSTGGHHHAGRGQALRQPLPPQLPRGRQVVGRLRGGRVVRAALQHHRRACLPHAPARLDRLPCAVPRLESSSRVAHARSGRMRQNSAVWRHPSHPGHRQHSTDQQRHDQERMERLGLRFAGGLHRRASRGRSEPARVDEHLEGADHQRLPAGQRAKQKHEKHPEPHELHGVHQPP